MVRQTERATSELPRSLRVETYRQAFPVILHMVEMYQSQLGSNHAITTKVTEVVRRVAEQLGEESLKLFNRSV